MLEQPIISNAGWTRVAFGDVVRLSKARVADPEAAGIERVVGLEHIEPGELRVRRWGDVADGTTFTTLFKPGQVLFGKRRAYQRKVAVADFEGVCSGDIYVLEPANDRLMLELLPFVCQTDAFFEHAVGTSAGSLSPRTNWTSLASFEFLLPPTQEQARFVKALSASQALVEALTRQLDAGQVVFQAAVDDIFTRTAQRGDHAVAPLSKLATKIVDGVHHTPSYTESGVPFLTVENLTRGQGIDFSETRFVSESDHAEFIKRAHPQQGDVLISKDGTLGVSRVVETSRPFSIFVSVALVKPVRGSLEPWFLRFYFDSSLFKRHIGSRVSGSALKHIHLVDLRESPIPVMSVERQMEASQSLSQIHASLEAIEQRIVAARAASAQILSKIVEENS